MTGFTEVHAHFLWGLDDGADSPEVMAAMLDTAQAQGVSVLYATPHMTPGDEPFPAELMGERLEEARNLAKTRGMTILAGAELLCTPMMGPYLQESPLPVLGDSKRVLVEFFPQESYSRIELAVSAIKRAGYEPLMAHIERYSALDTARIRRLREKYGAACQVNCSTVLGRSGRFVQWKILRWVKAGLVDCIASDAHNVMGRPFCMGDAYEVIAHKVSAEAADSLTHWQP